MQEYFAYGSNLDPVQMSRRCPDHQVLGPAVLADHRLGFPRRHDRWDDAGVAGVEPAPGQQVHGVAYRLSDRDFATLDRYEAVAEGEYTRERVTVTLADGTALELWTYFAVPDPDGPFDPTPRYLDGMIRGAEHHGLPADWIARLRAIPARNG